MPRRDGAGPMGGGAIQGRSLGVCNGVNSVRYGAGSGIGFGRNFVADPTVSKIQKNCCKRKKNCLKAGSIP